MLSKLNLKRKCIAILCSVATAAAVLPAAPVPVFADATKVVSIGNDLTDAQKKTMMRYFGIENDKSVQQITVTNKMRFHIFPVISRWNRLEQGL